MQMSSKKTVIAVAITTVALTIGSVGISQASSTTKVVSTKITRTSANGITNPMANMNKSEEAIASVLSALVAKGTITQAQADAIKAAFAAAAPLRGADKTRKGIGPMNTDRVALEALISKTIGVDTATVRTRLAAGESLGAIAGAKKAELIAALVADATKRIDAAVTAGKLTAAQATTLKAGLTAHVTAEVDRVGGKRGPGMGGSGKGGKGEKGGRGHDGPRMDGKAKAPKIPATAGSPA
jgi:polyhydroxyalkanoate synthesis regulator phasin